MHRQLSRGAATALMALVVVPALTAPVSSLAAPRPRQQRNNVEPQPPPTAPAPTSPAPADVNQMSLRIAALTTLRDFDLSPEQLRAVRPFATGAADTRARAAAKAPPKLAAALKELHDELLKPDAEHVDDLAGKVDDLLDEKDTALDDAVHPTDAARAKAPEFARRLKASQIAAYLAEHAGEVSDPVEHMMAALAEAREEDPGEAALQEMASDVGRLVAGADNAKVRQVATQVMTWIKSARDLKPEEFAARQPALQESAQRIVGDVPPMQVLAHWLEGELAELLSNPQFPAAVDAMLAARGAK
jgi:hypothetical protein